MADNTSIKDAAAATVNVASDDVGGVQYQRVKIAYGADGSAVDVQPAAPFPVYLPVDIFGGISVSQSHVPIFYDLFDTGTVDTVARWNSYGSVAAGTTTGATTLTPGVTASATVTLSSQPSIALIGPYILTVDVKMEATASVTGVHRFWGFATTTGNVGTSAAPITDGYGFEVDTTGVLRACVYASGTRVYSQTVTYPTDGNFHAYSVWTRGDVINWTYDSYVSIASTPLYPNQQNLPVRFHCLNSASPSAAPTMTVSGLAVSDLTGSTQPIGDATYPWRRAQVGKSGGIAVKGAAPTGASLGIASGSTGTVGPVDVSEAGNVTFTVKNTIAGTAFATGGVLVFEQSDDGTSWAPIVGVRSDTNLPASTHVLGANTTNGEFMFDAACEGVNWVRARLTTAVTSAGVTIVITPGGMPFSPAVATLQPARTAVNLYAIGLTAGTTATEALVTASQQKGTAAATSSTSFVIPNGKTFRIQSINISLVGNSATATAANMVFRIRFNTGGAVATTSTIMWNQRLAVTSTLGIQVTEAFTFADGMDLPGNGTLQYGLSVIPTFATNAPTYDFTVTGYEY